MHGRSGPAELFGDVGVSDALSVAGCDKRVLLRTHGEPLQCASPTTIRGVDQGQITLAVAGLGLVGSLVGALVGSFIGPWVLQRSQAEAARKQAIRDGFAEVLRSAFAMADDSAEVATRERIAHAHASTKVELLLRKEELPIVSLMAHMFDAHKTPDGGVRIAHAGAEFARWLRGEVSATEALRVFRRKAGIPSE